MGVHEGGQDHFRDCFFSCSLASKSPYLCHGSIGPGWDGLVLFAAPGASPVPSSVAAIVGFNNVTTGAL